MLVPIRVHQHHTILIEQAGIALHDNGEPFLALERQPCAAIGENISAHGFRCIERGAHALADFAIPAGLGAGRIEARFFPQSQFGNMGSRFIAPRHERRLFGRDGFQRGNNIFTARNACGIGGRSDEHKIIIHDVESFHAETFSEKFLFCRFGVNENNIGIATSRCIERLARALRNDFHLNARLRLEERQEMIEQAGILRRCGRGHNDAFFLRQRGLDERKRKSSCCDCSEQSHVKSPRQYRRAEKPVREGFSDFQKTSAQQNVRADGHD